MDNHIIISKHPRSLGEDMFIVLRVYESSHIVIATNIDEIKSLLNAHLAHILFFSCINPIPLSDLIMIRASLQGRRSICFSFVVKRMVGQVGSSCSGGSSSFEPA